MGMMAMVSVFVFVCLISLCCGCWHSDRSLSPYGSGWNQLTVQALSPKVLWLSFASICVSSAVTQYYSYCHCSCCYLLFFVIFAWDETRRIFLSLPLRGNKRFMNCYTQVSIDIYSWDLLSLTSWLQRSSVSLLPHCAKWSTTVWHFLDGCENRDEPQSNGNLAKH